MEDNAVLKKEAPTDKPPRAPWSKKTKIIVWSIVGAVVIAAIVIGIVFGVRANQYKMRTFTRNGTTYEQFCFIIDRKGNNVSYKVLTPRGKQDFVAINYFVPPDKGDKFEDMVQDPDQTRFSHYSAFISDPVQDGSRKHIAHVKMILYENDHKYHYYENMWPDKEFKVPTTKQLLDYNWKKPYIITPKSNNPLITGTVEFNKGVLLHVENGIITNIEINGEGYHFEA